MFGTQATFARAALDQTPPLLTVPVRPAFVVGSVVDQRIPEDGYYFAQIQQLIQWSATDNVGVCSYDLQRVYAGADPAISWRTRKRPNTRPRPPSTPMSSVRGVAAVNGYLVTARDCTGNATTKAVAQRLLLVLQEDGVSAGAYAPAQDILYTGTWRQSNCACFLAGHTSFTTMSGARATFTRTYEAGDQVALVMAEGPGRGRPGSMWTGSGS